jgi:hypothetical protein
MRHAHNRRVAPAAWPKPMILLAYRDFENECCCDATLLFQATLIALSIDLPGENGLATRFPLRNGFFHLIDCAPHPRLAFVRRR